MSELYIDGASPPCLRGQACGACGNVAFPPNPYGCETCGAPAATLSDQALEGRGILRAFVTTHHGSRKDIAVPFTVASIALNDGPIVRAVMIEATDASLNVGDTVHSVLVDGHPDDGEAHPHIKFQRTEKP